MSRRSVVLIVALVGAILGGAETRFAEGKGDRLPSLADDLVRSRVDVLLTGADAGALAAKRATSTIPIVMVTTGDPVKGGIVPT